MSLMAAKARLVQRAAPAAPAETTTARVAEEHRKYSVKGLDELAALLGGGGG